MQRLRSSPRLAVALLFVLLALAGTILALTPRTGTDTLAEMSILASNTRSYCTHILGPENGITQYLESQNVPEISQSVERDHGVAAYLPLGPVLVLSWLALRFDLLHYAWRLYTFLLVLAGAGALYCLARFLLGQRRWALAAVGLFLSYPRLLGDALVNNKDLPLLSFVLLTLWFGVRFVEQQRWWDGVFLGLVAAFAANARILGLLPFGLVGLLYLAQVTLARQWSLATFGKGALTVGVFGGGWLAITPAAWAGIVPHVLYVAGASAAFTRWRGHLLFGGQLFAPVADGMPWQYLPVSIAITLPLITLALGLAGQGLLLVKTFCPKPHQSFLASKRAWWAVSLVCLWLPVLFALFSGTILYNSWRHFYFIYGLWVLGAVYALRAVARRYKPWLALALVGVQLTANLAFVAVNAPYYNAYFNPLAAPFVQDNFETDYWGEGMLPCIQQLYALEYTGSPLVIAGGDNASKNRLPNELPVLVSLANRVVALSNQQYGPTPEETQADYWIVNESYAATGRLGGVGNAYGQQTAQSYDWYLDLSSGRYQELFVVKNGPVRLYTVYKTVG